MGATKVVERKERLGPTIEVKHGKMCWMIEKPANEYCERYTAKTHDRFQQDAFLVYTEMCSIPSLNNHNVTAFETA